MCGQIRYTSTYLTSEYKVDIIKKYYNEQNTYLTGDYKGSIIK